MTSPFSAYLRLLDDLNIRGTERRRALDPLGHALGAEVLAFRLLGEETPAAEIVGQVFSLYVQRGQLPREITTDAGDDAATLAKVAEVLGQVRAFTGNAYERAVEDGASQMFARGLVVRRAGRLLGQRIACCLGWPVFDIHVGDANGPDHRSLTPREWESLEAAGLVQLAWADALQIRTVRAVRCTEGEA
jgi:hypothetical protein